jgi:HD-like signal output (HDOD) protein
MNNFKKTKVNEKFIGAMQKRLEEKDKIYKGKLNYKSMAAWRLDERLNETIKAYEKTEFASKECMKKLVDIANFCWMTWERLGGNQ